MGAALRLSRQSTDRMFLERFPGPGKGAIIRSRGTRSVPGSMHRRGPGQRSGALKHPPSSDFGAKSFGIQAFTLGNVLHLRRDLLPASGLNLRLAPHFGSLREQALPGRLWLAGGATQRRHTLPKPSPEQRCSGQGCPRRWPALPTEMARVIPGQISPGQTTQPKKRYPPFWRIDRGQN